MTLDFLLEFLCDAEDPVAATREPHALVRDDVRWIVGASRECGAGSKGVLMVAVRDPDERCIAPAWAGGAADEPLVLLFERGASGISVSASGLRAWADHPGRARLCGIPVQPYIVGRAMGNAFGRVLVEGTVRPSGLTLVYLYGEDDRWRAIVAGLCMDAVDVVDRPLTAIATEGVQA